MRNQTSLLLLAAFTAMGLSMPAFAVLGGNEADIQSEALSMKMALRPMATNRLQVRVHEMNDATRGIQVRQYAGRSGKIFAVTWDGRVKPDLKALLGTYFDQYLASVKSKGLVRGVRRVSLPDLDIRLSGHMRHFYGTAWVPSMVPAGVDPKGLQ